MPRAPLLSLLALAACAAPSDEDGTWQPSLTMIRDGSVLVANPPVLPADHFIESVVRPDTDYSLPGEPASGGSTARTTDTSEMRELDDPEALEEHQGAAYSYSTGDGSLYDDKEDDFVYDDVAQGAIGDCYFAAALSSVLYADEEHHVRDGMIRTIDTAEDLPTRYAVRFYDAWGNPQDIEVDADLVRKNDRVTYLRSKDSAYKNEEWAGSLVEKAYALWHGGYPKIGEGGWPGDVMQALTGANATYRTVTSLSDDSLLSSIDEAVKEHRPVVAATFGEEDGVDYEGTSIYAWHAYSVLGTEDGGVVLRNPWGEVEPADNGEDDGIFTIGLPEFRRLYQSVTYGGAGKADTLAPAAVKDLALSTQAGDAAVLSFSATGDDSNRGLASSYELRTFTASPPTIESFPEGTRVTTADPELPGTQEKITIQGLGEGSTWVALRVSDESGNVSGLSNVVEIVVGEVDDATGEDEPDAPAEVFYDFEGGEDGWNSTGLFHLSSTLTSSGSGAFWMGDEDKGSYDTGSLVQASLTSPSIELPVSTSPTLLWQQLLDVESGASYDTAIVQVSIAGSSEWTTLWAKEEATTDFELVEASLADFAGELILIRFTFDSVDSTANEGLGWAIDDVWVTWE